MRLYLSYLRCWSRLFVERDRFAPVFAEVEPARVGFFDEGDLFGARPAFELLFSGDGCGGRVIDFVPDEARAAVLGSEAIVGAGFVFAVAADHAVGHADVEDAGSAGHDVDEVAAVGHSAFNDRRAGRVVGCDGRRPGTLVFERRLALCAKPSRCEGL